MTFPPFFNHWILALGIFATLPAAAQQTVKIGVLAPITGDAASDAAWLMKGHQLAVDEANARGGIRSLNGAKIELVVGDTQSKPETGRSEAERLVDREKVAALVGGWASSVCAVVSQVAERNSVPFVMTSAVADNLTEKKLKYAFRVSPKSKWVVEDAGRFLDHMASKGTPVSRVALLYEDGPYGQSVANNYKLTLAAKKISVVADESFRSGVSDLSTQVSKIRAANADVVLFASFVPETIVLFRAMSAQNFKPLVLGYGSGYATPVVLNSSKAVEGSFGVVEWRPDLNKDAVRKFVSAFEAKYKMSPGSGSTAQAYAATWAVIDAIENAKSAAGPAVRDGLSALKSKSGPLTLLPLEEFAFDSDGQLPVGNVVVQVIDGKFVTVWPPAVAAGPMAPVR